MPSAVNTSFSFLLFLFPIRLIFLIPSNVRPFSLRLARHGPDKQRINVAKRKAAKAKPLNIQITTAARERLERPRPAGRQAQRAGIRQPGAERPLADAPPRGRDVDGIAGPAYFAPSPFATVAFLLGQFQAERLGQAVDRPGGWLAFTADESGKLASADSGLPAEFAKTQAAVDDGLAECLAD